MLLIPVVQQRGSVIHIYTYTLSLKKDIKLQSILKIINLCQRILSDNAFLQLFLKFSLCRVSLLWVFLSWRWAAFSLQCLSCCTLPALVLYLGLDLLCALRSSSPCRSVQETLSLSPGRPRGEVRGERDLGLQLRERL